MTIKFQDLDTFTERDVAEALGRNTDEEISLLPITVALVVTDSVYAQEICLRLASDHRAVIRGNVLVSLGHLARRFRSLDEFTVKRVIEAGLVDNDEYVRLSAKSAADEIHQFLGWIFENHVYGI